MVLRQAHLATLPTAPLAGAAITIDDVAAAAGVSTRTVSRVLNNSPKVGSETRRLIQDHIERLQFRPNSRARGLAAGRSFLIGVVQDDPNAQVIGAFQRGIVEVCSEQGYELVVHPARYFSPDVVDDVRNFVRRSRVDGLLLLPPLSELQDLALALQEMRLPAVAIASVRVDQHPAMLISDERGAVRLVADHLVGLGHRRIAMITGPEKFRSASERLIGFREALALHGVSLPPEYVERGDYSFPSGLAAARKLLALSARPSAIFASNDNMAAGVLQVASEMGIAVPADLSVFGFDDSDLASMVTPPLSTVRRPIDEMARDATRHLLQTLTDGTHAAADRVELKLVVRSSTAPPSAAFR